VGGSPRGVPDAMSLRLKVRLLRLKDVGHPGLWIAVVHREQVLWICTMMRWPFRNRAVEVIREPCCLNVSLIRVLRTRTDHRYSSCRVAQNELLLVF
jgi:hypothetical protein